MEKAAEKITREQLLWRELIWALLILLSLFWLALLLPAPLSLPAGAAVPAGNPVRAPWIFLALQTLLFFLPPVWGGLLIPAALLVFLVLVPWASRFSRGKIMVPVIFSLLFLLGVVLTVWGALREF
jgi:hypothetical protein